MEPTVIDCLASHASEKPGATFCTLLSQGTENKITFAELYTRSQSYAATLLDWGVQPGDRVIIILKHSDHLFYSFLGAMLVGAIPTFIPFPSPKQRADLYWHDHDALFQRIQPALIVTYGDNLATAKAAIPASLPPCLIANEGILEKAGPKAIYPSTPHDVACLQHSSGTTGLKKGVMLSHGAITGAISTYAKSINLSDHATIASWLPLYHDMGFIACFMTSVVRGTHLVSIDPFEWVMRPSLLLDAIERHQAHFTWLPNFAFSHLVNGARKSRTWDLSSMRAFINCSEPCKSAAFDRFLERFGESGVTQKKLQVCYAMAENVFGVTQTQIDGRVKAFPASASELTRGHALEAAPNEAPMPILSCGVPLEGVELRIVGEMKGVLPPKQVGEIALRSPFMFDGYYRLPEKTSERLRDGWYYTGDMGFMDDGELFVTGRKDDMIIVNGRNYYAHEIERLASEVTGVLPGRNVAIGLDEILTDSTVIVVLAECAEGTDAEALVQGVRKGVLEATGLALHAVIPLRKGELVKTTSGKISRTKNKELYVAGGFKKYEGA